MNAESALRAQPVGNDGSDENRSEKPPTAGGLDGMVTTTGILTFTATGTTDTPPNNFDDIAGAIATRWTGLGEPTTMR